MLQEWRLLKNPLPPPGPPGQPMLPFRSALQIAARSDHPSIVSYLLGQGLQLDLGTLPIYATSRYRRPANSTMMQLSLARLRQLPLTFIS